MKKLILLLFVNAITIVSLAQSQVITIHGDTINDAVAGLYWKKLEFKNSKLKLDIMDVKEISGDIPKSRLNMIMKLNKNIIVNEAPQQNNYIEGMYGKNPLKPDAIYGNIPVKEYLLLHPTGTYLRSAGTYYLTAVGLSISGVIVSNIHDKIEQKFWDDPKNWVITETGVVLSKSKRKELNQYKNVVMALSIASGISSIIGHVKLVQAGKSFTKESITLGPAQSGLGLAINF